MSQSPGSNPLLYSGLTISHIALQMSLTSPDQPEGASYPRFESLWYSLDVMVPFVSLEMQECWLPNEARWPWGVD